MPDRAQAGPPLFDARTRLGVLLLGFASGLPAELIGGTLQTRLRQDGLGADVIGLLVYATLPLMLKPLWAPLVDRWRPPLGRRRGWVALALLALAPAIAALGWADPTDHLAWLLAAVAAVAAASATLDLAANAYACDSIVPGRASEAAGLTAWGYRGATVATSFGVLGLAAGIGWGWAYTAVAGGCLLCLGAVAIAREPPERGGAPATLAEAVAVPLAALLRERGPLGLVLLLAFALLFRLADAWAGNQTGTVLVDAGFAGEDIGLARGPVALAAAGAGVLAAGYAGVRLAERWCLLIAGILGAVSNLAFIPLAEGSLAGLAGLWIAVAVEAACGGFLAAIFVGFLMRRCTSSCAATQYALLTAVWLLGRYLTAPAGMIAEAQGWTAFFLWSAAAGLPGLALIPLVSPRARPAAAQATGAR